MYLFICVRDCVDVWNSLWSRARGVMKVDVRYNRSSCLWVNDDDDAVLGDDDDDD